uniref:Zgc:163014 n=1 Tax=Mastacembelus armatus TaxID=205130 RepID=A0A3Q3LBT9_9TELE
MLLTDKTLHTVSVTHTHTHSHSHSHSSGLSLLRSKSNRRCFQVHIPLPLPKLLVIFGLGEWKCSDTTISVEVLVSAEVQAQKIGILTSQARYVEGKHWSLHTNKQVLVVDVVFEPRCLIWDGDWSSDIVTEAAERGRRGVYGKIVLTVCGEVNKPSPSPRWSHTMCLSDPDTAVLIGGETAHQGYCSDSLWKIHYMICDIWFPIKSSVSGPVPPCAQGHSATYDPDSKALFVYGGLREAQRYSDLYILNTLTWKWKLVTAKGNVPNLAFHSAAFYKKELFVFGGVRPSHSSAEKSCSNALYIFNPEFELWYQPIVEGDRPLPRFGHTATLLSQRLIIFGGRKTATYFNDLHILDLGKMKIQFHAALPVSDNRILVSGGCSAIGALHDIHIFNTDTNMWSSVTCPLLSSKPRAGHSMISLGSSILTDTEKQEQGKNVNVRCTLLVFGGSDCSGTFYNDTLKCEMCT